MIVPAVLVPSAAMVGCQGLLTGMILVPVSPVTLPIAVVAASIPLDPIHLARLLCVIGKKIHRFQTG